MQRLPLLVLLALVFATGTAYGEEDAPPAPTLTEPPQLLELVAAEVPGDTEFPTPEVEVLLRIELDATGAVVDVTVEQGAGEPFDGAALAAAREFRFSPARLSNGETVPVTISFRLRIEAPPPPPVRFSGRLLERGTRRVLADVPVLAREAETTIAETVTDAEGRFSLEVPATSFRIVALPSGHEKLDAEVTAEPGEEREETFYLETVSTGFETIIRAAPVRREVVKQVIPRDVVTKVVGTQGDTIKVVQNFPGVARASFGSGLLVLRGSAPGDSRVYLEGQEIPLLYHFGGLRSTFNNHFLDTVEFVPGNFSADYGRSTGGVIDVKVRDPADDAVRGHVDINVYDAGFAVEGPVVPGLSMGGGFHRSYIDTLLPLILPDDAPLSFDTAPRYYDYQFLTTWKPGGDHRLRLLWYGSMDKIELVFERPQDDPAIRGAFQGRLMFHDIQLSHGGPVTDWLRVDSSVQAGIQEFRTVFGPEFFFDLTVWTFSARSTWTAEATDWLDVRLGLDTVILDVGISLRTPSVPKEGEPGVPLSTTDVFEASQDTQLYRPGMFLELAFEPLDGFDVVPSLRLDYYSEIDALTVDPRLFLRYQILPITAVKAGVGLYQQPPEPDESASGVGNPDLLPERSIQFSLGVTQQIIQGLDLEVTGFYKALDRLVVRNPDASFAAEGSTPLYVNSGTGRIFGVEVLLKAQLAGDFFGWIAYTYQRSFRTDGPGTSERRFDFDQPHILTVLGTYEIGRGWSVGLRFRLVSGNPDTPVVSSVYDASTDTYVPIYGATNSARLALFHQLDLRVDKVWTFDTWRLNLYLEVLNVYNNGAQEGWQYNYDYSERGRLTGLPILPVFGIRGEW